MELSSLKLRQPCLLSLAVIVAYSNVWPNDFVYDDSFLIVQNAFLKSWSHLGQLLTGLTTAGAGGTAAYGGFYRPVVMLAHFLVYQLIGPSPFGFHALNIALQALNACLLYRFGTKVFETQSHETHRHPRLVRGSGSASARHMSHETAGLPSGSPHKAGMTDGIFSASFAAALLWAVHPVFTSNITYMSSTPELLGGTFVLAGLTALLPDFTPRKIWRAAAFFLLALGAKENTVVFPALAAVTFFFVSEDRAKPAAYLKLWPLWVMAAVYIVVWLSFMHHTGYSMDKTGDPAFAAGYTHNLLNRIITCLATLPLYAKMILWPSHLYIERNFPIFTDLLPVPLLGLLMAGLSAAQIIWGRAKRGLALSFGLLWFAIALAPVSNIAVIVDARLTEGWMYLPAMGLFLGIAQTATSFSKKYQKFLPVFAAVAALALAATTFTRNEAWRNDDTLCYDTLAHGGNIDRIAYFAALYNLKTQNFDRAVKQFNYVEAHPDGRPAVWLADVHMSLAMSLLEVRLNKGHILTMDELDRAIRSSAHIDEAADNFAKALQDDPNTFWAHKYLAAIYNYKGNRQMADFHEKRAADLEQGISP